MASHQSYLFVKPRADHYLNTSVMSAVYRMRIAEGLSDVGLLSGVCTVQSSNTFNTMLFIWVSNGSYCIWLQAMVTKTLIAFRIKNNSNVNGPWKYSSFEVICFNPLKLFNIIWFSFLALFQDNPSELSLYLENKPENPFNRVMH